MNFSEVQRSSGQQVWWSPDGRFCALAVNARLEVRHASSLHVLMSCTATDAIQVVEWAPDSCYILTANHKRCVVEVWSIDDPDWRCKIDEGSAGLIKVCWAPDSRHVLTTADFSLRITVWSLVSRSVAYIKQPKSVSGPLQFSPDQQYLAVPERYQCKDSLSLFETKSWQLVKNFETDTKDLAGVLWSSDGSVLAVWESPLNYKVLIYSLSGHCLASYSAYQWSLGVKGVAWSPSGQFLAVGSYDQKVRLLNHLTWSVLAELPHSSTIDSDNCVIYKEVEKPLTGYPATLAAVQGLPIILETVYEEVESRPVSVASVPPDPGRTAPPRMGVSCLLFSPDSRYLATRNENMPTTVWIWSVPRLSLSAVLVHSNPIKDLAWDPRQPRLALCTSTNCVYFWSPFGCLTVAVPGAPGLQVSSLRWHPNGSSLALVGRDQFSVCFLDPSHR